MSITEESIRRRILIIEESTGDRMMEDIAKEAKA